MDLFRAIAMAVAPLERRVRGLVSRAVLQAVADAAKMQEVQVTVRKGDTRDGLERWQPYGLTSVPHKGAEALVLHVGGSASHGVVIAVDDRRYRLTGLEAGEVALYDDQGQSVHLKRDNKIHVKTPGTVTVEAATVELGGVGLAPTAGVVQGDCIEPVTGLTFAALGQLSAKVRAAK